MPIYEFYCRNCHTIYKFFSRTVNTEKVPACPKCDNPRLERRVSLFAILSGKQKEEEEMDEAMLSNIDESKLERAMAMLESKAEQIDEDDPRQAAQLLKEISHAAGLKLGPAMEEALHRMEQGEDPEKIEEELGDLPENELFSLESGGKIKIRRPRPRVDETLYDL